MSHLNTEILFISAIHINLSYFATFFIVMRAKISIVEIITHNYKIQNSIKQADTINFDKFNVNKIGHTNKNINIK